MKKITPKKIMLIACTIGLLLFLFNLKKKDPFTITMYNNEPIAIFHGNDCHYTFTDLRQNYQSIAGVGYQGSGYKFEPQDRNFAKLNSLLGKNIKYEDHKIYYFSMGTPCVFGPEMVKTVPFCTIKNELYHKGDTEFNTNCHD